MRYLAGGLLHSEGKGRGDAVPLPGEHMRYEP
jgi:hypothetical protein